MAPYLGLRGASLNRAIIILAVCPAFICYGYNLTVAGGLLTLESFVKTFPQLDAKNTEGAQQRYNSTIQGTIVALFTVGGIFGSLSCIYLGDLLGRRRIVILASTATIIGAILMATAFGVVQFAVARIILGLGTGGYLATVPVWQAEISKTSKRGAHVVTDGIFIGIGTALGLWVDFGFYYVTGSSASWRVPLALQIPLLSAVVFFFSVFPESPRWLVKKDRQQEARQILAALDDISPDSESISADIRDIEQSLSVCGKTSWKAILTMGEQRLFHRTVLAATGQIFQQICGINAISMYATTIFEQNLRMSPTKARILAAAMCLTQPLGGSLASVTIDRLGRRTLMLWSAAGMSACMAILAGTTSNVTNTGVLIVAAITLFAFTFIYTVGYSGLTFLYATEVAPLQYRAAISAVSTTAVWTFNFLLAEITPLGFDTLSYRYYVIFAVLNAAIVPVVYLFFPETKGRSLEEIDQIFSESKSAWDPPRIARRSLTIDLDGVDIPVDGENGNEIAKKGSI